MNAAYGIPEHAAAKIMYSMERKGIITDNDDNERFRLNDEFAQDGGTELIDTLDRAGNNDIKEIAQMLEDKGGIIVEVGDVNAMKSAFDRMSSPDVRKEMSDWLIEKVTCNYTVESVVNELIEIYKR